jgi:hypothetical protein
VGAIPLCPVSVFRIAHKRAGNKDMLFPFKSYASYNRSIEVLAGRMKADPNLELDWGRPAEELRLLSHSAKVGGACALLKAGYEVKVIQTVGDWADDRMVSRYAVQVILEPSIAEAFPFYNPSQFNKKEAKDTEAFSTSPRMKRIKRS